MAHSPSQVWENDRLVERAKDSRGEPEPNRAVAAATKDYRAPLRTPRSAKDREAYAKERAWSTTEQEAREEAEAKAVAAEEAEDKAVSSSRTTKKAAKSR